MTGGVGSGLRGHKSPQRELGDGTCGISGVGSGVAFRPAVPGLAPRGFYAGEREGWPWHFETATHTRPALTGWVIA